MRRVNVGKMGMLSRWGHHYLSPYSLAYSDGGLNRNPRAHVVVDSINARHSERDSKSKRNVVIYRYRAVLVALNKKPDCLIWTYHWCTLTDPSPRINGASSALILVRLFSSTRNSECVHLLWFEKCKPYRTIDPSRRENRRKPRESSGHAMWAGLGSSAARKRYIDPNAFINWKGARGPESSPIRSTCNRTVDIAKAITQVSPDVVLLQDMLPWISRSQDCL